ncbi:phospholipid/cholesterol/gamma-HCH transport system permease protein [Mariniflexile fucanivorans]|uniref:Phospholipid/cholesterol/gamma-HCH transport system permease protein n=1 Tax=Mariniflexile fucanivorans TaxID=264023 RepID=A0A4V2QED8_9FLAO|nr:ABC transporter permease [Mariniflexile fucanivorans]TCL67617.1 phospholipid/cholesterol/gamma-HCH transport system permease protein [Mariniflexile fucanivorans]
MPKNLYNSDESTLKTPSFITLIKDKSVSFFIDISNVIEYLKTVMKNLFTKTFEFQEFLKQCYQIGNKSVGLISITGIIVGLVLTIQSRPPLVEFGAVAMLPGMVAISIIREMGPVITALICAGKIGSSMGAELGSMRVTEQIDAMEVSNTNPINFLIIPRVLAATVMIPLLTLYADAIGIFGSWLGINIKDNVSLSLFINQAFSQVEFIDVFPAVIKSFFFGAVIGLVGCYKGYNAGRGTESVGIAANSAVVTSSLLLIIVDLIAVQITDLF